jgi:hypothetical protein
MTAQVETTRLDSIGRAALLGHAYSPFRGMGLIGHPQFGEEFA